MISSDLESEFGVQYGWQKSKSGSRESSRKALAVVQVRRDGSLDLGGGNERRAPQVPPALLKPASSLDPATRVCSRIRRTWKRVHNSGLSAGVSSSRKPSADKASPARVFRKLWVSSALRMLTPDAVLGLGGSRLHSRRRSHFSCCLAFSRSVTGRPAA